MNPKKLLSLISITLFIPGLLVANAFKVFPSYALSAKGDDDQWHQVVGFSKNKTLISTKAGVVQGKAWVRPQEKKSINDQFVEVISVDEETKGNNLVLNVRLKSSVALSEPFAAIVYKVKEGNWKAGKCSQMPNLTGEEQVVRLRFNNKGVPEKGWTLHFFHGGMELYDPSSKKLKEATPTQAFYLQLARHISAVGDGDANPAPFFMPIKAPAPDLLPDGSDPVVIKTKIRIGRSGRVDENSFVDPVSPALQKHLTATIDEWLFFPRIKQGELVEQAVVVPIKLR